MTLVDSSVWIDFFRGVNTVETEKLDRLLGSAPVAIGDLILTEVLQGFESDRDFERVRKLLSSLDVMELGGEAIAIQAARNFRMLRRQGVTVRKTIDVIIATWCIENRLALLQSDRDFEPFVQYLGLKTV